MRRTAMRLALSRHEPKSPTTLVRHEGLRKHREGSKIQDACEERLRSSQSLSDPHNSRQLSLSCARFPDKSATLTKSLLKNSRRIAMVSVRMRSIGFAAIAVLLFAFTPVFAQSEISAEVKEKID